MKERVPPGRERRREGEEKEREGGRTKPGWPCWCTPEWDSLTDSTQSESLTPEPRTRNAAAEWDSLNDSTQTEYKSMHEERAQIGNSNLKTECKSMHKERRGGEANNVSKVLTL